jgi:hypothetical protein
MACRGITSENKHHCKPLAQEQYKINNIRK